MNQQQNKSGGQDTTGSVKKGSFFKKFLAAGALLFLLMAGIGGYTLFHDVQEPGEGVYFSWDQDEAVRYPKWENSIEQVFSNPQSQNDAPVVVIGDTSGSMPEDELVKVAQFVRAKAGQHPVLAVWADDHVQKSEWVNSAEQAVAPPRGGGTDFAPAFEYLVKQGMQPGLIIYVTDGGSASFPTVAPGCPVLWVLTSNRVSWFKPPFGAVASY